MASRNDKGKGKQSAPKGEIFLCVSCAVSGRCPLNGNILSLAAVAVTEHRVVLGSFSENLLPLPGGERLAQEDVIGFWTSKRDALEAVSDEPQPAADVFARFAQFCKSVGKCTLVGSPLLSVYGWLIHYWAALFPPKTAMPWGFSGVCCRSFASGALGVSVQDLAKNESFMNWHENLVTNHIPKNDAFVTAVVFTNALRASKKAEPCAISGVLPMKSEKDSIPTCADVFANVFSAYPSITDPLVDPAFADQCVATSRDLEWVVLEKVHGSNMTLLCDPKTHNMQCAKRTALVDHNDPKDRDAFFHFDRLLQSHKSKLQRLADHVASLAKQDPLPGWLHYTSKPSPDTRIVVAVVGEIAGGKYVHPEVPLDLRGVNVQNGVQYFPNNFFYAFDIAIIVAEDKTASTSQWHFLPFDVALPILENYGFFAAKPLFRGSASEAFAFDPVFPTTIPSRLGIAHEIPGNEAEGVVIRPASCELPHATSNGEQLRIIAKLKHPSFSEFSKVSGDLPAPDLWLHLVRNSNRVRSVISKIGTGSAFGDIATLLVDDALRDVMKLRPGYAPLGSERSAAADAAAVFVSAFVC